VKQYLTHGVVMQSIKILRLKDVIAKTGLSRSNIYSLLSAGKFPKKIQLSPRCIGFLEADIDNWLYEKTLCQG
jgi:prophage regulatory protein